MQSGFSRNFHITYFNFMKNWSIRLLLPLTAACIILSCADNEDPGPHGLADLTLVTHASLTNNFRIELYADQNLFAGYNPVTVVVRDRERILHDVSVVLEPVMTMNSMSHGCPVEQPVYDDAGTYHGAVLFTMPSGEMGFWNINATVVYRDETFETSMPATVEPAQPSRVLTFTGSDNENYYAGYHFTDGTKIGVNPIEIVVFRRDGDEYIPVEDLTISLTPEMPSMGHGSPNNEDPVHEGRGHYKGKVNFTMTGDWRLTLEIRRGEDLLTSRYFDIVLN